MNNVRLEHVYKTYPGNITAVRDVNLEIKDGEFVVLVGPSGCGKSTTLRMVAGLEEISDGSVYIGDRLVNNVPPKERDIAMVFQNYALYPHMSVYDNMAFGLKLRRFKRSEIDKRVKEAAALLSIEDYLERKPKNLSGGQRQRVAVGRAIVRKPAVYLFDEPLSNLDAKMRVQMRTELSELHNKIRTTMIYVTHDQVEAMTMGDRIVVMKDGIVQQIDAPIDLYDNPVNTFVAGFIGTPPMNFFEGEVVSADGKLYFKSPNLYILLPAQWKQPIESKNSNKVIFGIRPEDVGSDLAERTPDLPKIHANINVVEPMGSETYLFLRTDVHSFIARVDSHRKCKPGENISVSVLINKAHLFDAHTTNVII